MLIARLSCKYVISVVGYRPKVVTVEGATPSSKRSSTTNCISVRLTHYIIVGDLSCLGKCTHLTVFCVDEMPQHSNTIQVCPISLGLGKLIAAPEKCRQDV